MKLHGQFVLGGRNPPPCGVVAAELGYVCVEKGGYKGGWKGERGEKEGGAKFVAAQLRVRANRSPVRL